MKLFDWIKIIISLVIIAILFNLVKGKNIISQLSSINMLFVILAIVCFLISTFFDFIRIYLCINHKKETMSLKETWEYFKAIWSLSFFLPSRLGDVSWVFLLKKKGMKMKEIIWILVLNLLFVYGTFGILALFGIDRFILNLNYWLILLPISLLIVCSLYMFVNLRRFLIWGCAIIKVMFQLLIVFFLLYSVQIYTISITDVGLIQALAMAASFLPITFAGLGARESIHTFLFTKLGVEPASALLVTLMNTIITYLVVFIITLMVDKTVLGLWKKKKA